MHEKTHIKREKNISNLTLTIANDVWRINHVFEIVLSLGGGGRVREKRLRKYFDFIQRLVIPKCFEVLVGRTQQNEVIYTEL